MVPASRRAVAVQLGRIIDVAYEVAERRVEPACVAFVQSALEVAREAGLFDYQAHLDKGATMTTVVHEARAVLRVIETFPNAREIYHQVGEVEI